MYDNDRLYMRNGSQTDSDTMSEVPDEKKTDASSTESTSRGRTPFHKRRLFKAIALTLVFSVGVGFSSGIGAEFAKATWFKDTSGLFTESSSAPVNTVRLSENGSSTDSESKIISIAENVAPSIVTITSKTQYRDFFDNTAVSKGAGSGVVFKMDGDYIYLMTNNHVIENASQLLIQFNNGAKASGTVMGTDPVTDLAIVKVKKSDIGKGEITGIKVAVLGDSDKLKVGQTAVAIGNPLDYGTSVTAGVISAVNRKLESTGLGSYIQTDAAINPGNSGGALLNSNGEVVGINTIKISEPAVEGMGFAIPVNAAKPILAQLFDKGFVSRPYLGIYGNVIDQQTSEMYNLPVGVLIAGVVKGTGAEKAGLKKGDVIIAVEGSKVNTMDDLSAILSKKKVGDVIKVKLVREAVTVEKSVTLADRGKN